MSNVREIAQYWAETNCFDETTREEAKLLLETATEEELIDVADYDYAWQLSYTWKEPKFIPAGTRLFVEGAFDNSADNPMNPDPSRDVPWGQMSEDEMFFGAFTWKNVE